MSFVSSPCSLPDTKLSPSVAWAVNWLLCGWLPSLDAPAEKFFKSPGTLEAPVEQIWYDVLRIREGKHVSSLIEMEHSMLLLAFLGSNLERRRRLRTAVKAQPQTGISPLAVLYHVL